jgi:hypothetical protein
MLKVGITQDDLDGKQKNYAAQAGIRISEIPSGEISPLLTEFAN